MVDIQSSGVVCVLVFAASLGLAARVLSLSTPRPRAAERVIRYTATVLLAVGSLGACLLAVGGWAFIAWPIVMTVWVRAAINYRNTQKRNLLSALTVAIEKQMPVGPMAAAFANEQERGFAVRAQELADQLERGVPVADVLRQSRQALPPESALAAAVGLDSGDMAGALDATIYASVFDRTWLQPVISRLFYLLMVLAVFGGLLTFLQVNVLPAYVDIFEDFDLSGDQVGLNVLPSAIASPAFASSGFVSSAFDLLPESLADWLTFNMPPGLLMAINATGWLILLMAVCGLIVGIVFIYVWLQWRGTLQPRLPGLRRIIRWVDAGPVLRMLALAAGRDRPLIGTLVAVSRWHPKWSVRRRMRRVVRSIDNGIPWYDAMRKRGFIDATDAAILAAAGYSGNLTWALTEMASSFERKATYRMQAVAHTVVPLLLLPVGLATAVVAVGYFAPLTALIQYLS